MTKKIAIIGCGNLGLAIVHGLLDGGVPASSLLVTRRNVQRLTDLSAKGVRVESNNKEALDFADIIILTVKPYNVAPVLEEIVDGFKPHHTLISAATGIDMAAMRSVLKVDIPVFRAMPNTAADVKESLTCLCYDGANQDEIAEVMTLFDQIGKTIIINESLMEAATVLGACGIAYVLRFIRGMIQGGIEIGFDAQTATHIVSQTVKGAAELLITRQQHPEHEIDKVTTPRGCTITGLNEMEHNGFSSSLIKGIVASYDKIA
jgi:pyrroline-5-carboxylate reductase